MPLLSEAFSPSKENSIFMQFFFLFDKNEECMFFQCTWLKKSFLLFFVVLLLQSFGEFWPKLKMWKDKGIWNSDHSSSRWHKRRVAMWHFSAGIVLVSTTLYQGRRTIHICMHTFLAKHFLEYWRFRQYFAGLGRMTGLALLSPGGVTVPTRGQI